MSDPIEPSLTTAISSLFGGRVYPDIAPQGAAYPFALFQQVGGEVPTSFCEGVSARRNGRFQFWVWAKTRNQASTLMRAIETTLTASTFRAVPLGALVARYEDITDTYGAQQDFSIWH
jgi:CO dehydrogenase/acetyl-CoA synthase beta subunit